MSSTKLFKNVRLKGQKELTSILVEDGVFKRISADLPEQAGCEVIDLQGQLVIPPYVDPHMHLDYVFTAGLGEENGSGTLFEGIQRWSESKGHMSVEQMKERIYSGIRKEMLNGVQAIRTHIDVTDPTFTGLKAALEVRDEVKDILDLQIVAFPQEGMYAYKGGAELVEEKCMVFHHSACYTGRCGSCNRRSGCGSSYCNNCFYGIVYRRKDYDIF